jgi:hypothetical protein
MIVVFPNKDTTILCGQTVQNPKCREDYLALCKRFLVEEDYKDICVAILDKEFYLQLETSLQKVVDAYYTHF